MNPVVVWWTTLIVISAANVVLWVLSYRLYLLARAREPERYRGRGLHVVLSAVYVGGCALRAMLPRVDVSGACLVDTMLSNVLIGRSVATVAELCFAAQWVLLLRELAAPQKNKLAAAVSSGILPLIALAELFSWYAVLKTQYLAHAAEQSLWTLTTALVLPVVYRAWKRGEAEQRRFLALWLGAGVSFIAFMSFVDVPMYIARWRADLARGRALEPLAAGFARISEACRPAHDWQTWREEIAWMTLYFTIAVWVSIALVHAPRVTTRQRARSPARTDDFPARARTG